MKRIVSVLLTSLLILLLLPGCEALQIQDPPVIRAGVDSFINAVMENDPNDAYSAFHKSLPRAQFNSAFPQIRDLLMDVEEYSLLPIHLHHSSRSDGKSITHITYRMDTNCGTFIVIASAADNKDGLLNLQLTPEEQTTLVHTGSPGHMEGASVVQWTVLVLGFAVWGFVLWAFVDCCRRKIRTKPLWLLLIALAAVVFHVTASGKMLNFRFNAGIYLAVSSLLRYGDGSHQLQLVIPLGAILYVCLRKRLERPSPADVPAAVPAESSGEETSTELQE